MHFTRLLHLADSALPTGSFAYSAGLESSISLGLVRDDAGLRNYLYAYLQQAGSLELPFLNSCFALGETWRTELLEIAADYDAQLLVPALRRASATQGRTWLKLLHSLYPKAGLDEVGKWFAAHELPPHLTLIFALSLQRAGFALSELQALYLHLLLRDQLSAAIRLGQLGPLEGHRLQHDFYAVFEPILAAHAAKTYQQASRSAFLLEAAQMLHADMYSRLFQT